MLKSLHSLGSCVENFLLIHISSILSVIFIRLWLKRQRVFWWPSCTSARHAGSFDCLMTSLILIKMDNGRGHSAYWQSCRVPNQTHRGMKTIWKIYAIKQIKICAEYRDMLPRPRLDLSGTPGLRPIGLSPGSWQTGLGRMTRYSAQILICITQFRSCPMNIFCCMSFRLLNNDPSLYPMWAQDSQPMLVLKGLQLLFPDWFGIQGTGDKHTRDKDTRDQILLLLGVPSILAWKMTNRLFFCFNLTVRA